MAEAAQQNVMEEPADNDASCPPLIKEETKGDNSLPTVAGAGLHPTDSPLPLRVFAQRAVMMDSDTDFSDFECNTFAKRVLHSPRIGIKKDSNPSLSDLPLNQSRTETWQNQSYNPNIKLVSHFDEEHVSHFPSTNTTQTPVLSEASSYDSNTDTDTVSDTPSSPLRSGILGKYGKLAPEKKPTPAVDELILNRLPGENLGLVFGVEGGQFNNDPITSVVVKDVIEEGVAYRKGIRVGDKILEINGIALNRLSHDECVSVIQEMPLQIVLNIKRVRQQKKLTFKQKLLAREKKFNSQWEKMDEERAGRPGGCHGDTHDVNGIHLVASSDGDDSDFEEGFTIHEVFIQKSDNQSLGLSVVPSYGSTRNLYQVKRLLPSGVGAQSGKLKVGDRLLSCNHHSLRGVTQSHCLNILKSAGERVTLKILRQIHNDTPMEISVHMSDPSNVKKSRSAIPGSEEIHTDSCNKNFVSHSQSEASSNQNVTLPLADVQTSSADLDMSSPTNETKLLSSDDVDFQSYETNNQPKDVSSFDQPLFDSHISSNQSNFYHSSAGDIFEMPVVDEKGSVDSNKKEFDSSYQSANNTEINGNLRSEFGIPPPTEFADTPVISERGMEDSLKFEESVIPFTNIDDLLGEELELSSGQNDVSSELIKETNGQTELEFNGDTEDDNSYSQTNSNSEKTCDLLLDIGSNVSLNNIPDIALRNQISSEKQEEVCDEPMTSNKNLLDGFNGDVTEVLHIGNNQSENLLEFEMVSVESSEPKNLEFEMVHVESSKPQNENLLDFDDFNTKSVKLDTLCDDDKSESKKMLYSETTEPEGFFNANTEQESKNFGIGIHADFVMKEEQNDSIVKENNYFVATDKQNDSIKENNDFVATDKQNDSIKENKNTEISQNINELPDSSNVTQIGVMSPDSEFLSPGNVTLIPVLDDKTVEEGSTGESGKPFVTVTAVNTQPSITKVTVSNPKNDSVDLGTPGEPSADGTIPGPLVITVDNSTCDIDHTATISVNGNNIPEERAAKPTASKRKQYKVNTSPIHVPIPTMPARKTSSDGEDVITPLCMKRNEKGVRVFEEGSALTNSPKRNVTDETARRDLATILLDLSRSTPTSGNKHQVEERLVNEDEVVPEFVSREQAAILMDVFQKWLPGGSDKKLSPFKKVLSGGGKGLSPFKKAVSGVMDSESKEQDSNNTVLNVNPSSSADQMEATSDQREVTSVIEKTSGANGHIVSTVTEGEGDSLIHKTFVNVTDTCKPSSDVKHRTLLNVTNGEMKGDNSNTTHRSLAGVKSHASALSEDKNQQVKETTEMKMKLGAKISSPPSLESSPAKLGSSSLTKFGLRSPIRPVSGLSNTLPSLGASLRTLGPSRSQFSVKTSKMDYPKVRQEDLPFQVDVLKGIVGLGMKMKVSPDGFARVTEIQNNSPVAKNGNMKVGDIILSINNTDLTGQSDGKVQQVLRLLPRGLAKIVVSAVPPSGDNKQEDSTEQSELEDMSYYPGRTSPFGVRLGAKPFNAAESKSVTVTSPLSKDRPFFSLGIKKVPASPALKEETEATDGKENGKVEQEKQIFSVKTTKDAKLGETKPVIKNGDKKETKREDNVSDSLENKTSFEMNATENNAFISTPSAKISQADHPVPKGRKSLPDSKSKPSEIEEQKTNKEIKMDSKMEVVEDEVIVMSTGVKTENKPITKSEPKPEDQQDSMITKDLMENVYSVVSDKPDDIANTDFVEIPATKVSPAVPPKPKGRKSLQELKPESKHVEPPSEEISGVKKSPISVHSQDMDPIVEVSTNGKVFTQVRIPVALKPRVHTEDDGKMTKPKIPPAVAPKPTRKSSASSDVSNASIKSDGSHSTDDGTNESRTRTYSNRSDASYTLESVKSEIRPRRYSSSSSSSSRFEDATSEDETSTSRMQERLGKFEDLQGSESHTFSKSKPQKKRRHSVKEHMAMFESMKQQDDGQQDLASSRKAGSKHETEKKQDEAADVKMNAALFPRYRGQHAGSYTRSVPDRQYLSSSSSLTAPVSLTKPSTLSKLKGLVLPGQTSSQDNGTVAQSGSPQGQYTKTTNLNTALAARKISREEAVPVKIGPALLPRRTSREDIKIFTAKPFKVYSSGDVNSSVLSGKVDIVSTTAQNSHNKVDVVEVDLVKTKTDHTEQSPVLSPITRNSHQSHSEALDHVMPETASTPISPLHDASSGQSSDQLVAEDNLAISSDLETLLHLNDQPGQTEERDTTIVSDANPDSANIDEVKLESKHSTYELSSISLDDITITASSTDDIVKPEIANITEKGFVSCDITDLEAKPAEVLEIFSEKLAKGTLVGDSAISDHSSGNILRELSDDVHAENVLEDAVSSMSQTLSDDIQVKSGDELTSAELLQQAFEQMTTEHFPDSSVEQSTTDDGLQKLSADVEEPKERLRHHILETIADAEPEADNVIDEVSIPQETLYLDDVTLTDSTDDQQQVSEKTQSLLLDLDAEVDGDHEDDDLQVKSVEKKAEASPLLMFLSGMQKSASDNELVSTESQITSSKPAFFPDGDETESSDFTTKTLESLSHEVMEDSEKMPSVDPNDPQLIASVSKLVSKTIEAAMEELGSRSEQTEIDFVPAVSSRTANNELPENEENESSSQEKELSAPEDTDEEDAPPPPLPGSAPPPLPTSKPPEVSKPKEEQVKSVEDRINSDNSGIKIQDGGHGFDKDTSVDSEYKDKKLCSVDIIDETMVKTEKNSVTKLPSMTNHNESTSSSLDNSQIPVSASETSSPVDVPIPTARLNIDTTFSTQKETSAEYGSTIPSQLSPMSQSSDSGVVDIRNTSVDIDTEASASETLTDELDPLSPTKDMDKKEIFQSNRQQTSEDSISPFDMLIDFNQIQETSDKKTQLSADVGLDSVSSALELMSDKMIDECAIMNFASGANDTCKDSLATQPVTTSVVAESSHASQSEKQDISSFEFSEISFNSDKDQHVLESSVITSVESLPRDISPSSLNMTTHSPTAPLSNSDILHTSQEAPACEPPVNAIVCESPDSLDLNVSRAPSQQVPTHIIETSVHATLSESHDSDCKRSDSQVTYMGDPHSGMHDVDESKDSACSLSSQDDVLSSEESDLSNLQVSSSQESAAKENGVLKSHSVDHDTSISSKNIEDHVAANNESCDNLSADHHSSKDDDDSKHFSESIKQINDSSLSNSKASATISSRRKWKVLWKPEGSVVKEYTSVADSAEVCVMSQEELKMCVDLANGMMDRVGQGEKEVIKLVVLKKELGENAGIELEDGVHGTKMVSKVTEDGIADRSGVIHAGDCLWSLCGKSAENSSTRDLHQLLTSQSTLVMALSKGNNSVVSSSKEKSPMPLPTSSTPSEPVPVPASLTSNDIPSPLELEPGVFNIVMHKGVTGVGFCLEGGLGSPRGDLPITIKRIFKGGPADKCGHLKVKDQILKVNEIDFSVMRHYEAWNHLKFLPDGEVHLIIRRET